MNNYFTVFILYFLQIIKTILWLHNLNAALNIPSLENVSLVSMIKVQMENAGNIA